VVVPAIGKVTFTSPNYPKQYPNNAGVVYNVAGPEGFGIQVKGRLFSASCLLLHTALLLFSLILMLSPSREAKETAILTTSASQKLSMANLLLLVRAYAASTDLPSSDRPQILS
jgi:hypothetical protein